MTDVIVVVDRGVVTDIVARTDTNLKLLRLDDLDVKAAAADDVAVAIALNDELKGDWQRRSWSFSPPNKAKGFELKSIAVLLGRIVRFFMPTNALARRTADSLINEPERWNKRGDSAISRDDGLEIWLGHGKYSLRPHNGHVGDYGMYGRTMVWKAINTHAAWVVSGGRDDQDL